MPSSRFVLSLFWFCVFSSCETRSSSPHPLVRRYDSAEIEVDASKHDLQFFSFVTRPDFDAPRWEVKVYNEDALAPGYWFMSPYGIVSQSDNEKAYVGPHIYDSNGELIWSGFATFEGWDIFDFKVSNVDGRDMLTAIYPHDNHSVIIDNNYEYYKKVESGITKVSMNMHDFGTVDNGTRALYLNKDIKRTSKELSRAVDFDGHCNVEFTGFEERDLATDEVMFSWSPEGRIGLDESTMRTQGHIKKTCDHDDDAWDYLHMNSIEKLPDGDYLASGRRSYALYKISHDDGSILWRLGGKKSDFELEDGLHFSGQHDARCLSQNSTHTIVSIMDNASGPGKPAKTNPNSRGLVMSLNTETMIASEVKVFDHPHGKGHYAPGRGNLQFLPNGNAFLTWMQSALQSEHTPDGEVVMEARLPSGLKTYRGYKFPWVGRPSSPPDVHSEVVIVHDTLFTAVHVSWNGDTEVAQWHLYKTDAKGDFKKLVASSSRTGFETALTYEGYAGYIVVEGVDRDGNKLGESKAVQTLGRRGSTDYENDKTPWKDEVLSVFSWPVVAFIGGVLFSVAACLSAWAVWTARRKGAFAWWRKQQDVYAGLPENNGDNEAEKLLSNGNKVAERGEPSDDD